jgi:hypothetical protein
VSGYLHAQTASSLGYSPLYSLRKKLVRHNSRSRHLGEEKIFCSYRKSKHDTTISSPQHSHYTKLSSPLCKIMAYIFKIIKCKGHDVGEICRLYEGNENVRNIVTRKNEGKRWHSKWKNNIKIGLEWDSMVCTEFSLLRKGTIRIKWWTLRDFRLPEKLRNFSIKWETIRLSKTELFTSLICYLKCSALYKPFYKFTDWSKNKIYNDTKHIRQRVESLNLYVVYPSKTKLTSSV